jgi:hypothetical protein
MIHQIVKPLPGSATPASVPITFAAVLPDSDASAASVVWHEQLLQILTTLLTFNPNATVSTPSMSSSSSTSLAPPAAPAGPVPSLLNAELMARCLEHLEFCVEWAASSPKLAQAVLAIVTPPPGGGGYAALTSSSIATNATLAIPFKARWLQLASKIKSFVAKSITQHVNSMPS